jgi:hypothetical protein
MKNVIKRLLFAPKYRIKQLLRKTWRTLFRPMLLKRERQDILRMDSEDAHFRMRAMSRRAQGKPISVLFACDAPDTFGMFESVYKSMADDPDFAPLIVTLPYKHSTLPAGQYKDAGMSAFCESRKIPFMSGYDKENNEWLNPVSLMPDYVFFQSPYNVFPPMWSVQQISKLARVCYIPYASLLEKGELAAICHPEMFFRFAHLFFTECSLQKELLIAEFKDRHWVSRKRIVVSGHPKIDHLTEKKEFCGKVWKRGLREDIKRILWTPRWNTWDGTCHFFDYKDYFVEFCKEHHEVDFVFRPHSLCFQNFIKTGEMSREQQRQMKQTYDRSVNMSLDANPDYEDTFMTSDVLVSDFSSMLLEYLATGKPIIYTHRRNVFNEYGLKLSEGLYWARNARELGDTLAMLLSGNDPLCQKRKELMNALYFVPEGGAGRFIKEYLKSDYRNG